MEDTSGAFRGAFEFKVILLGSSFQLPARDLGKIWILKL